MAPPWSRRRRRRKQRLDRDGHRSSAASHSIAHNTHSTMRAHRSHRDGRDIDAGFYFRDGRVRKYFARPRRKTLDVKRTWALFDALVSTGRVEYIFVSYRIQRALYRYALKQGVSKRRLNRLFQWPRHWRKRAGLIRWERGHEDHFHVRFRKDPVADPTREASQGE